MRSDAGTGRYSVAFPEPWWYPVGRSRDIGSTPVGVTLMETPIVVFRDARGAPHALLDRCAHRNVALSAGRVADDGCIECCYHGWRFDGAGACRAVPGLRDADSDVEARRVPAYAACEENGFVWIWGKADDEPRGKPYSLPALDGRGSGEVVFGYDLDATLHASLENALDVPHTAFLHAGIFRGGDTREITAQRREIEDGIEVEYLGEPVGLGSLRADQESQTQFDHWDRFILPSIAQIEYRVEGWLHIINTILHLPMSPFVTRAWFVVRYWTRLPAPLVRPIVLARGTQILRQDAKVLARQTENTRRFGGERYASTPLDIMGNAIWRKLREAERNETEAAGPHSRDEAAAKTIVFGV